MSVLCAGLQIRAFHQKARVSRFLPAHNHFLRLYPSVLLINSKLAAGDRGRTHREGLVTHSKHYKNRAALCSFYLHINTLNPHSKFKKHTSTTHSPHFLKVYCFQTVQHLSNRTRPINISHFVSPSALQRHTAQLREEFLKLPCPEGLEPDCDEFSEKTTSVILKELPSQDPEKPGGSQDGHCSEGQL